MNDCIFCSIFSGTVSADIIYRDDNLFVIKDISPQAPIHLLVIPAGHYVSLTDSSLPRDLLDKLIAKCSELGQEYGKNGFRIVVNTGPEGGQTVSHLHFHVMAGRTMQWPPG